MKRDCRNTRDQVQRRLRLCHNSLLLFLVALFSTSLQSSLLIMLTFEQMEKILPFITWKIALCQNVCELFFGVNILDLGFGCPNCFFFLTRLALVERKSRNGVANIKNMRKWSYPPWKARLTPARTPTTGAKLVPPASSSRWILSEPELWQAGSRRTWSLLTTVHRLPQRGQPTWLCPVSLPVRGRSFLFCDEQRQGAPHLRLEFFSWVDLWRAEPQATLCPQQVAVPRTGANHPRRLRAAWHLPREATPCPSPGAWCWCELVHTPLCKCEPPRFQHRSPFAPTPLPLHKLHGGGQGRRGDGHTGSCERTSGEVGEGASRARHDSIRVK